LHKPVSLLAELGCPMAEIQRDHFELLYLKNFCLDFAIAKLEVKIFAIFAELIDH